MMVDLGFGLWFERNRQIDFKIMAKQFTVLPPQAYVCCLSGQAKQWASENLKEFRQLIHKAEVEKTLFANFIGVMTNQRYEVDLLIPISAFMKNVTVDAKAPNGVVQNSVVETEQNETTPNLV